MNKLSILKLPTNPLLEITEYLATKYRLSPKQILQLHYVTQALAQHYYNWRLGKTQETIFEVIGKFVSASTTWLGALLIIESGKLVAQEVDKWLEAKI